MSFTLVTVIGRYLEPDDVTPARGHIDFQLTNDMADGLGGVILARKSKRAVIDSTGNISLQLAATDDTTTQPLGTLYLVTENIVGAPTRNYYMALPKAVPIVNTASMPPIGPSSALGPYVQGTVRMTVAAIAPSSPNVNDVWVVTA